MQDLHLIVDWAATEARAFASIVRELPLWTALVCGLVLWTLAYQIPYTIRLDIGGEQSTLRQRDDEPFLQGFNDSEPPDLWKRPNAVPFRWTTGDATITLPGIGGGGWNVSVRAAGRPDNQPIGSQWSDGASTTTVFVRPQPANYHTFANANMAGDVALHFVTPAFQTPTDPRQLGFVMLAATFQPTGGWRMPAMRQLGLLAAALALAYALCRRFWLSQRHTLALALGLVGFLGYLLARERLVLTLFTPTLCAILAGAYGLGMLLDITLAKLLGPQFQQAATIPRESHQPYISVASSFVATQVRPTRAFFDEQFISVRHKSSIVVGLVVLGLILRLGGVLHPHALFSDVGLNVSNLIAEFEEGTVYFTEGLPSEAGGGKAPYPPAQYVVAAPAQIAVSTDRDAVGTLLKVLNVLADSLLIVALWYVLQRSGYGERTALVGAALYLLPPPLLKSMSVGELANIFGQALALVLLAFLVVRAHNLTSRRSFIVAVILFAIALLGHLGVTISLLCVLVWLGAVWLFRHDLRPAAFALCGAALVAGLFVALVYYAPLLDTLTARLDGSAKGVTSTLSVAKRLQNQLNALPAYGLNFLALSLGAIGTGLVAARTTKPPFDRRSAPLGTLLLAWWGGSLLSLGLLIFASQGVRWQQFLYPALCLSAAPVLAALWRRGPVARFVGTIVLVFLLWHGLDFWVTQIHDYFHV